MRCLVGTSGYNYTEWRGTFYPEKWPASKMFGYYAERFRTVEINYTFYRMPTPALIEGWVAQAPAGFLYTLKAPKRITHVARLKDCAALTAQFVEAATGLGGHLATGLFQLPPFQKRDLPLLADFVATLPPDFRAAFEFRHESWLSDEVYDCLAGAGKALCIADFGDKTTPVRPTARYGYLRLRDEGYTPADIEQWADAVAARERDWDEVFVYFKHEDEGKGPEFAAAFERCLVARGIRTS
jgi:uncharacterized protein YecE (DUF72 family)